MHSTIYPIVNFLQTEKKEWLDRLVTHVTTIMNEKPSDSQVRAWDDCFNVLQTEFENIEFHDETYFVFEYELDRERGRRPDLLLLSGKSLYVLEFKQHNLPTLAQVDQASAYGRDLQHYHHATHTLEVKRLLVLTGTQQYEKKYNNVFILSSDKLKDYFLNKLHQPFIQNIERWFNSPYEPLPSIISAAKIFFQNEALPQINRATSAGIPKTLESIHTIVDNVGQLNPYNLILITGVPGAGKTLVGLNYVHGEKRKIASFLSGNGPLVNVLQATLNDKSFVQGLFGFKKTYADLSKTPREDVIVFDEAQRAWDHNRMRGLYSEPEVLIRIGENKNNFTIIALIGEGQEIHRGEEGGIELWNMAINNFAKKNWKIFGPDKLCDKFSNNYTVINNLDLTVSLRTHVAKSLQLLINSLMVNNISISKLALKSLYEEGYTLYLTRNLEEAKSYATRRYYDEVEKTFGLIASSKGSYLKQVDKIQKGFGNEIQFFVHVDCKNYRECATEFTCQGLELDFPIVCWDDDLLYEQNSWRDTHPNVSVKDSLQLRINTYRVLLTRGRDGMIIYIPPHEVFNSTFELFQSLGIKIRK